MNGKLSAVRHANVQAGKGNPREGKLRLKQLMAGLKKFRGPTGKKGPVTIAMLTFLHELLDTQPSSDHVVTWASLITAFHLFCRSCEYLAKLAGGRFDLEAVFLLSTLIFYAEGQMIAFAEVFNSNGTLKADRAQLTFGKTKTGGGEVRTLCALNHPLCAVLALATMVTVVPEKRVLPDHEGRTALFAWGTDSTRNSDGVTYQDMQMLLKQAAAALGTDPTTIATHSIRRGAASAYLMSGLMSYDLAKMWGRWRSEVVREYVEVWETMAQEASLAVVNNVNSAALRPSVDLPSRDSQRRDAEQLWQATVQAVSRSGQGGRLLSRNSHQSVTGLGSLSMVTPAATIDSVDMPHTMCLSMQLNAAARTKQTAKKARGKSSRRSRASEQTEVWIRCATALKDWKLQMANHQVHLAAAKVHVAQLRHNVNKLKTMEAIRIITGLKRTREVLPTESAYGGGQPNYSPNILIDASLSNHLLWTTASLSTQRRNGHRMQANTDDFCVEVEEIWLVCAAQYHQKTESQWAPNITILNYAAVAGTEATSSASDQGNFFIQNEEAELDGTE